MTAPVSPARRWTNKQRCPVCSGSDKDPRGESKRCYGFLSDDGLYAHCSREEYGRGLDLSAGSRTYAHRLAGPCRCGTSHDGAVTAPAPVATNGHHTYDKIVKVYDYLDNAGSLAHQTVRFEPKHFSQRHPATDEEKERAKTDKNVKVKYDRDGAAWVWSLDGIETVLYRLPELLAEPNRAVFLVEGEKDADTLAGWGLIATCNPMGGGKWKEAYTETLSGRRVIMLPDKDATGADHAEKVAASLASKALTFTRVTLPGDAKDVTAWAEAGGTREQLEALVKEARKPAPIFPGEIGADELDELEFEPVREIVKNTIFEGAMLFAGAPKSGKSITMLSIAAACAMGGVALGKIRVERIRVLYFSLEEPKRLTQKRLRLMLGRGRLPALLRLNYVAPSMAQLLIDIERYVEQYPDTGLVVIDTLAHLRGDTLKQKKDVQQEDYQELIHFSHLAQRLHIGIVILSHTNKTEHDQVVGRVAGSYGLSGAVDGILLLERKPKSSEATLNVLNRELGSDVEHEMHWDAQILCYTVEGPVQEGAPKSDTWQKIMLALAGDVPMTIAEIMAETGMPESTVKPQVMRMLTAGDIDRPSRGVYSAKLPRYDRYFRNLTPENRPHESSAAPDDRYFAGDTTQGQSSESSAGASQDIVKYQSNVSKVAKVAHLSACPRCGSYSAREVAGDEEMVACNECAHEWSWVPF